MTKLFLFRTRRRHGGALTLLVLAFACLPVWSQAPAPVMPEKAARYHELLLKRPQPGTVFERFVAEWLAEGSVADLRVFLQQRAEAAEASTADRLLPGFLASRQNDAQGALAAFAKTLEADPENPAAWLLRAKAETRMVDYEAALASLGRFFEIPAGATDDMRKEAGKLRVQLLARTGASNLAAEAIQELARQHAADEALQDALLELQISEGLLAEAIEFAAELLERSGDPYRRVQRRLRLGDLFQRADRREEALAAYGQCLDDAAQDSWLEMEVLAQVERVFRQRDDVTGLAEHLAELAERHPQRAPVAQARAKTLLELGQTEQGLAAYLELLEKQPGNESLSDAYIDALARAGRAKEAVEVLRPRAAAKPQDKELRYRLIQLLPEARTPGEAVKLMEEMLAETGLAEFDHLRIARLYEAMDDAKEARRVYQLTVERFPESASAKDALASFLHAANEGPAALLIWRKMAETGDTAQALRVSRALSARGEHEAGLEVLEQRADAPADDLAWLAQKASCAIGAKRFDLAANWTRELLRRAETANALEAPLRLALQVFRDEEQGEALIKELQAAASMPVQERCLLAELLEARNEPEAADAALAAATAEEKVLALRFHAGLLRRRGDVEKAAELIRELLGTPGGRNAENLELLTQLLTQSNQLAEALKTAAEWKAAAPGSTRVWLEEARLLRMDGRADSAVETLRLAVRRFEGDTAVASALAEAYGEAGKWEDAQRIYTTLFEDAEDLPAKLRWVALMAQCAQRRGALAGLAAEMEERHAENPASIIPLLALAEVHRYTSNYEKRRRAMMEAARLRPKDAGLLQQIARLEESEGDWRAAVRTLELALPLAKDAQAIRQEIAGMHLRYGEPETGLRMMTELAGGAAMPPREAEAVSVTMMRAGYWDEARDFLQRVLAEQPMDYRLRLLKVISLIETSAQEKAADELVKLLTVPEELASPVHGGAKPMAENIREMRTRDQEVPEGLPEMWTLGQAAYRAQSYRNELTQNATRYGGSMTMLGPGASGAAAGTSFLPVLAEDVPWFATGYLLALVPELPEARRPEIADALKTAGIGPAHLLDTYEMRSGQNYSGLMPREDRFEEMQEDPVYLYLYVQTFGMSETTEDQEARLRRVIESQRESRPELAFSALFALCQRLPDKLQEFAPELTAMLDKEDSTKATFWSWSIANLLSRQPVEQRRESAALKELLAAAMRHHERTEKAALEKAGADRKQQLSSRRQVLATLHTLAGDWDKALAVVEEEIAAQENDANARQRVNYYYGSRSAEIQALNFSSLGRDQHTYSWAGYFFQQHARSGQLPEAEHTALVAAVMRSTNPELKLNLLIHLEMEEEYKPVIQELAARPDARLLDLMRAASLAGDENNHARAFELLLRARPLAGSTDERSQVEGALVHAALELKSAGKEELLAPEAETLKKSLLQLRHLMSASSRSSLERLAEAMRKFELEEQAASLKKMLAAQGQTRSSSSRANVAGISPDDFTKEVKAGRKEAAVAMAVAALRRLADGALVPQNYNAGYEARNWKRQIRVAKLAPEVWQACQPEGETVTFRQHAQLGFMGGWLGEHEAAREHLLECVKVRPKDATFRLRLISALLRVDRPLTEALAEWKAIDERELPNSVSQWMEELQDREETNMEQRLRLAEFAILLNAEATLQDEWVGYLSLQVLQHVCANLYANRDDEHASYPPLLIRPDKLGNYGGSQSKKATPEDLKRREEVARRLAEAVEKRGASAGTSALRLLITLAQRDGDEAALDDLLERATAFVETAAARKRTRRGMPSYGYSHYFYSNSDEMRMPQLGEFIIGRSFEKGRPVQEDAKWLVDLAVAENPEAAAFYRGLAALHSVPETEFVEQAVALQKTHANFLNQGRNDGAAIVLDTWRRRKLQVSPGPFVLTQYRQQIDSGNYPDNEGITEVARMLGLSENRKTLADFLDDLAAAALGVAPEAAAAFVEKNGKPNGNHNTRSPSWRVDMCWRALREIAEEIPEMAGHVIGAGVRLGFQQTGYLLDDMLRGLDPLKNADGMKKLIGVLDDLGLLEDLPEFDPVRLDKSGNKTLCAALSNRLRGDDAWINMVVTEIKQRDTFGARMVAQAIRTARAPSQWNDLKPYGAAFAQLPEEKQLLIAGLVSQLYQPAQDKLSAPDRSRLGEPLKPFFESLERLADARKNRLATAESFDELGMSESVFLAQARDLTRKVAARDPVAAAEQVERVVKLIMDRQEKGEWRGGSTINGYNQASWLLEKIASDASESRLTHESAVSHSANPLVHQLPAHPGCFELMLDLFTRPEQRIYGHLSWHHAYGWGSALEQAYDKAGGRGAPQSAEAVAALTAPFMPTVSRGSAHLAVIAYYDLLLRVPPWQARRTGEAMRRDKEMTPLAEAMELALALSAVNGFAGEPVPAGAAWPEALQARRDQALAWVKDEQVNPLARSSLAAFFVRHGGHLKGSEELVVTAMDLACRCLDERWPVTALAWQDTVHAFNRLDTQTDDWKALARRYLNAYRARCAGDDESRSRGRGYWPERPNVVAGLEMAALLGDEKEVNQWIAKFGDKFEKNMGSVLLLVRHGFAKQAAVIAERIVGGCDGADFSRGLHQHYQFEDVTALEKALPFFKTPLSALVARAAVATAPRSSHLVGGGDAQSPPWDERVAEVAKLAAPLGDEHTVQIRHLFQHLDASPGTMIAMADWAANRSGETLAARLEQQVKAKSYSSSNYRYLAAEALAALYEKGDTQPWRELVTRVAAAFGEDKKKRADNLHALGLQLMKSALHSMSGRPPAELLPLAEAAEALALVHDYDNTAFSGVTRPWLMRQLVLALNGKADDAPKRPELKRFLELANRRKLNLLEIRELLFCMCIGDPQNTTARPLKDRLKMLIPVLSDKTVATSGMKDWIDPLQVLRSRDMLTGPEIRQNAAALARGAWGVRHLPMILQMFEEAGDEAGALALLHKLAKEPGKVDAAPALPWLSAAAYAVEKNQPELAQSLLKRMPKLNNASTPTTKSALAALRSTLP